ncbi:hypothetical protein [Laspinema olomoucense]|uniref:hypothetical protein n=1 Tax=Laspinema olomoucense TaxID=3231600 RepID=UPI0021BB0DEF|nr:hypothetical protein [Laspinema sp. D3d]MCT7971136.1 hypothetical protein [Laspinema sp. D3d]
MKNWIIIPKIPGLLVLVMLILFGLDMAKPGIGQFAVIPTLRNSAQESIKTIPKLKILPNLPITEHQPASIPTNNQQPQPQKPPPRANCTVVETYAGQCQPI